MFISPFLSQVTLVGGARYLGADCRQGFDEQVSSFRYGIIQESVGKW